MEPDSFFHVAIKVADLDACADFYVDHFDADVVERGDADDGSGATAVNHVTLAVADKLVYLFDRMPYEAGGYLEGVEPGLCHFGFVVDDVDAAHEELTGADVDFFMPPDRFGDLKIAFFHDPAGVRVELIEHL
jgi:catechol 2,3-dioxygenase-like lactoylglutathione lyase family enzyme